MKRAPSQNPHRYYPSPNSQVMNRLHEDLRMDFEEFVKHLNMHLHYAIRSAMEQSLFNVLLYRATPIEYHDRELHQIIIAMDCREVDYKDILALVKDFVEVVKELREDKIYETSAI